jgi:hypothetical protein
MQITFSKHELVGQTPREWRWQAKGSAEGGFARTQRGFAK